MLFLPRLYDVGGIEGLGEHLLLLLDVLKVEDVVVGEGAHRAMLPGGLPVFIIPIENSNTCVGKGYKIFTTRLTCQMGCG